MLLHYIIELLIIKTLVFFVMLKIGKNIMSEIQSLTNTKN